MATGLVGLLSTEERRKTLDYVLSQYGESHSFSVRKVAKELQVNEGFVSRFFSKLIALNILSKKFELNTQNPLTKSIKTFLNVNRLQQSNLFDTAKEVYGTDLLGIGVYGSWASGTNHSDSDLDLWIKLKKYEGIKKTTHFLSKTKNALNVELNIEYLYPGRIKELKSKDSLFYHALLFGSIILYGESIES